MAPAPAPLQPLNFSLNVNPGQKFPLGPTENSISVQAALTAQGQSNMIDRFTFVITDLSGSGSVGCGPAPGGTTSLSANVNVGQVPPSEPTSANKLLTVCAFRGSQLVEQAQINIEVFRSGSGSGSLTLMGVRAPHCGYCAADRPVPVALLLRLDTPVGPGTAADCDRLNRPTLLVHSSDPGLACCWFSEPIDFCSEGTDPALWVLQKSDARTWALHLRRGTSAVASYRLTVMAEKDCSFPITLSLEGPGGPECTSWPRTVTIAPAP